MKASLLLLGLMSFQSLADLPIVSLSFNAPEMKQAFNASASVPRLVTVWSPT